MIIKIYTIRKNNLTLIFKTFIIILLLSILNSCNLSSNTKIESNDADSTQPVVKEKILEQKIKIDSIKMHAFDEVYFGTVEEISSKSFIINDINYILRTSQHLKNGQLCYFEIQSTEKITTLKKAKKVLNELKNTISKKYTNSITINKTYYVKHPEEMNKDESYFDSKASYKYDKKTIGLPYEFVGYKWNLKYKEIQIGYLIDYKNRTRYMQSTPQDNNYIIYIEFKSKILKQEEESTNADSKKDSNKF